MSSATRATPTREPAIRILGPTFSGTADSLARVLRTWTALDPKRRDAHVWVCSGAATAIDKPSFESNALPAQVTYAATVIPDDILLGELFHYLANPTGAVDPSPRVLPHGKIALLMETGSGYGAAVGNTYGTSGTSARSQQDHLHSISLPDRPGASRGIELRQWYGDDQGDDSV